MAEGNPPRLPMSMLSVWLGFWKLGHPTDISCHTVYGRGVNIYIYIYIYVPWGRERGSLGRGVRAVRGGGGEAKVGGRTI